MIQPATTQNKNVAGGIPVKNQKYFRISVPFSFTGIDLCNWISNNLDMPDPAEALHFANLLSQHGYYFPVIEKTLVVKDDNSLYRFQVREFLQQSICFLD